jgi:threonine synthase
MYFHDGFGPEFEITPDKLLANVPRLVIGQDEKARMSEAEFTAAAAHNVVGMLGLDKK